MTARPRVLVVDDSPTVLLRAASILETQGYEVLTAATGEAGLEQARRAHPDAIILDVMLPGMNGYEVCLRLKEDEATRAIPVIMLTQRGTERDELEGKLAGALFYLTKPRSESDLIQRVAEALRATAPDGQAAPAGPGVSPPQTTILLVDDSPAILASVERLLSDRGYRVLTASTGETALQLAEQARPNLILLDIVLPKLDGYQVCLRLRQNPATQHIPVVMLSNRDRPIDQLWAFEAGAVSYVSKSEEPQELLQQLQAALRGLRGPAA
ncbi:MAG: response regulator [Candidatus Omnitrophica bacterium]|nr:response regulator [Candidatus Omnitrophota bacterium]